MVLELGSVESVDMLCSTSFLFSLSMLASKLEKYTEKKTLLDNHGEEIGKNQDCVTLVGVLDYSLVTSRENELAHYLLVNLQ